MRDFDFVERDTDAYYQAMTDMDMRWVCCWDCYHFDFRTFKCACTDELIEHPVAMRRFEDLECYEAASMNRRSANDGAI